MEKSISFPYQRTTNLHIIHQPELSPLVRFLEQKYRLIETRTKRPNTIKDYQNADEKFRARVRLASVPLVGYAVVLAVVYFAELYFLLRLFNSIGFAAIGIYLSILAYLYFKFYRTKSEYARQFETPYYLQSMEISEIDLLSFRDQFTDELMAQFGYECFGKNADFKVLEEIEKDSVKNNVEFKRQEPDFHAMYESEDGTVESVDEDTPRYDNKYLSFLED